MGGRNLKKLLRTKGDKEMGGKLAREENLIRLTFANKIWINLKKKKKTKINLIPQNKICGFVKTLSIALKNFVNFSKTLKSY